VLLVGCGDGGSGCNVRADACGESPFVSGGGGDMGDMSKFTFAAGQDTMRRAEERAGLGR
jgi:hypothetical protein